MLRLVRLSASSLRATMAMPGVEELQATPKAEPALAEMNG